MNNKELAVRLVELIGGADNVVKATNCMTRLRLTVKDPSKVQEDVIKKTDGVLGLVTDGNTYQIVLGPGKVKKVMDICSQELGLPTDGQVSTNWEDNKESIKSMQKQSPFK